MFSKFSCLTLPAVDFGVILIPRCASRSMEVALRPDGIIAARRVRHGFIRDPLDHLTSFWNFAQVVAQKPYNRIARTADYRDMVDALLSNVSNVHFTPQSAADVTDWHLFEDLPTVWPKLFPNHPLTDRGWVGRSRKAEPGVQAGYRRADLLAFYADDIAIRTALGA
jgi:hypothetical protein